MEIASVFIIDDDEMVAQSWALHVEELGLEPNIVTEIPQDLDDFVLSVQRRGGTVICDQRLSGKSHSRYRGSDFVVAFYEAGVPSILTTAHLEQELPHLRLLQRRLPAVYSRKALRDIDVRTVFEALKTEFTDGPGEARKPYRTLVRVTGIYGDANQAEVVIPAWDPFQNVLVALDGFPTRLEPDARFFSWVNIGADDLNQIYFEGYEAAMPADGDDGLG